MAAPGTKRRKMSMTEQERGNVNAEKVKNEKYDPAECRTEHFDFQPYLKNRAKCLAVNDLQSYHCPCVGKG